ncbi:TetR family transcriptional regulator [Mycolicibacterium phlei]|uniref:TetR/AcrR family transcriptional regulator n=1 Tax=Mycobacteroides chelonae TaxID=1774 RepID=UPI000618A290|nr:TetR/AcrR family transcriptional regulator [Mycobacteroides chelonae]VEG20649.1 TetR family transcriptional regulator [Mycolicibacterium phlei]AKC40935.1 TetR family transcriptional regulator [Mycobacteroides chelonae]ANB00684.1 TetR family transcriptional regulator [Mycobacteroides chelonae CCUG 47445]OLT81622.1 TetR family transcriptional regulator [Mycobacteroides chelonae]ORV17665.1 TetR family transcriptional regulator [Mycobacteroides chelonae]
MPTPTNAADVPATRRARQRAQTTDEIKSHARKQLADGGTGALSLRAISREMGMAPAALFRYFDTQAALITALCVDANVALAEAMSEGQEAADQGSATGRVRAAFVAARRWALANPGDFALLSGTPIPGYRAQPSETGPAAVQVMVSFMGAYLNAVAAGEAVPQRTTFRPLAPGPLLAALLGTTSDESADTAIIGIGISAWTSITGYLAGEIFGSLRDLVTDSDALYDDHVDTVMRGMGFAVS